MLSPYFDLMVLKYFSTVDMSIILWQVSLTLTLAMARGDQVYLRPQGDLRLIVAHGNIAVSMLIEKPQLFLRILDVLTKLQVCTGKD